MKYWASNISEKCLSAFKLSFNHVCQLYSLEVPSDQIIFFPINYQIIINILNVDIWNITLNMVSYLVVCLVQDALWYWFYLHISNYGINLHASADHAQRGRARRRGGPSCRAITILCSRNQVEVRRKEAMTSPRTTPLEKREKHINSLIGY